VFETQLYFWIIIGLLGLGGFIPLAAAIYQSRSDRRMEEVLGQAIFSDQISVYEKPKLGLPTTLSLWLAWGGSLVVTIYALKILIEGRTGSGTLLITNPTIEAFPMIALTLYIDRLAAFFLLLIGGLSMGIAIYSFAYLREKADRALIAGFYNLFVLSGVLFVVANNVFFFIVLLELTTLAFGALVLHKHHEQPDNPEHQEAVKTYLIANHIGGAFVLVALLILALFHNPPTFDMSVFRQLPNTSSPIADNLVFLLALIGFGIKAGVVPFHIWVAIAHPSSPTNTHAMSLGIMIKIALYGMIRIFFQFFSAPPWWWGFTVLLVAAFTALIGVRNALYGRTLKDSLADHSVENIGIILAGIGLALLFASGDFLKSSVIHALTGLALVAGLYHLLNHTVFKGLLYLCTGAVDKLTHGVVELERLGGLIHRYRWTSACFLVGSVAIAGFPPFNGFISEWLTLQTLIVGVSLLIKAPSQNAWLFVGIILSTLLLASAFALTALAFVKIAGEVFLGRPRDKGIFEASEKKDVPWRMRGVLVVLAVLCLVLGILPWPVMIVLGSIVGDLHFPLVSASAFSSWGGISINVGNQYTAQLRPEFLFILSGLGLLILFLSVRMSRSKKYKKVWTSGMQYDPGRMQYTSSAFTSQVRDFVEKTLIAAIFAPITSILQSSNVKRLVRLTDQQSTTPFSTRFELSEGRSIGEPFRQVYSLLIILIQIASRRIGSFFQNGDLRNYLLYIFLFFVAVFIVLAGVIR